MSGQPVRPVDGPAVPAGAVVDNPWQGLRRHTPARIALGRAGVGLPTGPQLDFQLAHARARDAVHRPLDVAALCADLEALGLATVPLHSAAASRAVYLQRPDLGRRLDEPSLRELAARRAAVPAGALAITVADGLSSLAVQRHAAPLLAALLPLLGGDGAAPGWTIAPVAVVAQGRVAVGDAVGEALGAACTVVLIGERPGLSSPDSLGIYLTWAPRTGCTDAQRNCISNVRPEGLDASLAARRLAYLLDQARGRGLSGVALKDESEAPEAVAVERPNFLLGPG